MLYLDNKTGVYWWRRKYHGKTIEERIGPVSLQVARIWRRCRRLQIRAERLSAKYEQGVNDGQAL